MRSQIKLGLAFLHSHLILVSDDELYHYSCPMNDNLKQSSTTSTLPHDEGTKIKHQHFY